MANAIIGFIIWIVFLSFMSSIVVPQNMSSTDKSQKTFQPKQSTKNNKDGHSQSNNNNTELRLTDKGEMLFIELNAKFLLDDMNKYLLTRGIGVASTVDEAVEKIKPLAPKYHVFAKQDGRWGFWRIDYGK